MTTPVQTPPVYETLPLADLKLGFEDFANPRTKTGLAADDIDALAKDIKDNGLDERPKIRKITKDGVTHNVVQDGQRRILALGKLGVKEIEIQVISAEEYTPEVAAELTVAALRSTGYRDGLSSYEQAAAAAHLLELRVQQVAIGRALGRSKAWVSTMLSAWKKSTPELRDQWKAGKITDEQFKNLADVPAVKQPDAIADITTLREKGDRATARKIAKDASEKAVGKPTPRKIEVVTWDPKTKREVVTTMKRTEAEKKGLVHVPTPNTPAPPAPAARPPIRMVEEYAKLRRAPQKGARDPYVRGMLDMAAFVTGELGAAKFEGPWAKYLSKMMPALEKKAKVGGKGAVKKGSAIVARAKAKAAKTTAADKPAPRSMKKTKARKAKAAKRAKR